MRRLFEMLPGPMPVRVLLAIVAAVLVFVALIVLFEWAGDFLDDGGVIAQINVGPPSLA